MSRNIRWNLANVSATNNKVHCRYKFEWISPHYWTKSCVVDNCNRSFVWGNLWRWRNRGKLITFGKSGFVRIRLWMRWLLIYVCDCLELLSFFCDSMGHFKVCIFHDICQPICYFALKLPVTHIPFQKLYGPLASVRSVKLDFPWWYSAHI